MSCEGLFDALETVDYLNHKRDKGIKGSWINGFPFQRARKNLPMNELSRRDSMRHMAATGVATFGLNRLEPMAVSANTHVGGGMKFGLVTFLWGKDMDLPSLIEACEQSGMLGVELRTEHAHGVEPTLSAHQRNEVKKRFADSPVTLVGYGSNCQFHENDPAKVKQNIELTKQYIRLMHDCGGTGVKVKPNGFPKEVSREQTIEQIGKSLNEVAAYGEEFGQQIRVEVHGQGTREIPVVKAIFDVADHPNATICWNSNETDLRDKGLRHNFDLVKDRFGDTVHVHDLNSDNYPFQELMQILLDVDYVGWVLLEAHNTPSKIINAMIEQRKTFDRLTHEG